MRYPAVLMTSSLPVCQNKESSMPFNLVGLFNVSTYWNLCCYCWIVDRCLSFFTFGRLCCLSFFDLRILIWRRSLVFTGSSGFLHQLNWQPRYSWNIVESGVKHHKTNLITRLVSSYSSCTAHLSTFFL